YHDMTTRGAYEDEKGIDPASGGFACPAATQWVLMGDAGGQLTWQPSTYGLMLRGERCTQGTRHHMRFFQAGAANDDFGAWTVATPHFEQWSDAFVCHVIQSWTQGRDAFASFWTGSAATEDGDSSAWLSGWGDPATYQQQPFDARGLAVDVTH